MRVALLCLLLLNSALAEEVDRLVRGSEGLSAAGELAGLRAPVGFKVQLFAAEPLIHKPINMAFDTRGRLWVSSTREYPYAAEKGRWVDELGSAVRGSADAIRILQDSDGDGAADGVTIFADGLNIPTGVLPWHKPEHKAGCIAFSIPNLWYLADTDGDDRADVREVLFGPLGYEKDTHGMCSSLRLGLDGWVYATHGFSNSSTFRAKDGSTLHLHSGNTFRFRPDGSRVELWTSGQVNPFGLCWDRYNNLYSADCHSNPITQLLRGACYASFGKPHDGLGYAPVMCEHSHGSTGLCGVVYLDGGVWGPEWDDHMLVGNCVTSKVNQDAVSFSGSTPRATAAADFLTSDDPWFRPVDLQLGPDGALYVADFYNKIIGHYEVPLDHPGRDRERGRIWRVVREGARVVDCDFTGMAAAALAVELGDGNLTRRHLALREVRRRGTREWLPAFTRIFESEEFGKADVYKPMGDARPKDVEVWDTSPSDFQHEGWMPARADVRAACSLWALSYLGERFAISSVMRELHTGGVWVEDRRDEAGRLVEERQYGLLMSHAAQIIGGYESLHPWEKWNLGMVFDCRGSAAGRAVCQSLLERADFLADDPLWQAGTVEMLVELLQNMIQPEVRERGAAWQNEQDKAYILCMQLLLRDFLSQPGVFTNTGWHGRVGKSLGAGWFQQLLLSTPSAEVSRYLLTEGGVQSAAMCRHIGRYGDTPCVQGLLSRGLSAGELAAMHEGLLLRGGALPPLFLAACVDMAQRLLAEKQGVSLWQTLPAGKEHPWCLQERWDSAGAAVRVLSSLNARLPQAEQRVGVLRSASFPAPTKLFFFVCGHQGLPAAVANHKNGVQLVDEQGQVLRRTEAPRTDVCQPVEWDLSEIKGQPVRLELVDEDAGKAYAWIAAGGFYPPVIRVETFPEQRLIELGQVAAVLRGYAPVALRDDLAAYLPAAAALPASAPQPELQALLHARQQGYERARPVASRGELVFKMHCAVCHQLQGQGGLLGPQLDGIGKRGAARLLEDILLPYKNLDAHFRVHQVTLKDGSVMLGFLRGEVEKSKLLVDAAGKESRVFVQDIREDKELPVSLMSPMFGQLLSEEQCYDLVAWMLQK